MDKLLCLWLLIITIEFNVHSQAIDKLDIGVGMGIDYGGIGQRITYLPHKNVGLFGSLGYNLVGLGFNMGAQIRLPLDSRLTGYLTTMYGYNATIRVKGYQREGHYTYYGPSIGNGWEWMMSKKKNSL